MYVLLTPDELSERIKVKKSKIYDMVYIKQVPYTKIGNLLRLREDLIEKWMEQRSCFRFEMTAGSQ